MGRQSGTKAGATIGHHTPHPLLHISHSAHFSTTPPHTPPPLTLM
jgi:hypothetical protein